MTNHPMLFNLHFGSDDAELDEKRGFLDKVFLKTSVYRRVEKADRELVIGRKGSGKSAICLMLKKALHNEGHFVITITPQSLSRHKMEKLRTDSINQSESFVLSWKYALLVKLSIELIKTLSNTKSVSFKWIRKFLRDNAEIEKSLLQRIIPFLGSTELKLSGFGVEGSVRPTLNAAQQKDLADGIERFQDHVSKVLAIAQDKKYFILIDRVDDIWHQTEESKNLIVGLIKAIHELNVSLHHCQFMVFLRDDIYSSLVFNDSDKFHGLEERLIWEENDLKHLIATRGKFSASLPKDDVDEIWEEIFDERVMGDDSFSYIVTRTFRRPRDIIQFCNNALTEAQNSGHHKILASDILKAEIQYSAWKLKDMVSEFVVQYPYLQDVLSMFQGFKANFTRTEFEWRYQDTLEKLKNNVDLQAISSNQMLQILYATGFLGTRINDTSIFIFDNPNITLAQQAEIVIHPTFQSALNIQTVSITQDKDISVIVTGNSIGDINIAGDFISGNKVSPTYFESSTSAQIEREHLSELLEIHRANANLLRQQIATYGKASAPTHIINALEQENYEITSIEEQIRKLHNEEQ